MWTDNIYGKASQCLALPPTLRTPGGTTNGAGHTGPIHQWPHLLSQVGPLYDREQCSPSSVRGGACFCLLASWACLFSCSFAISSLSFLFLLSFSFYQQVEVLVAGDDTGWQRNATPHLLLPFQGWTHEDVSQTLRDYTCCHQVILVSHSIDFTGGARCLSDGRCVRRFSAGLSGGRAGWCG